MAAPRRHSLTVEKDWSQLGRPKRATLEGIVHPKNPSKDSLGPAVLGRLGEEHDWGPWGNRLCANPAERNLDYWFDYLAAALRVDGVSVKNSSGKQVKGRHLLILCESAGDPRRSHDKERPVKSSTAYTKLTNCQWSIGLTAIYEGVGAPDSAVSVDWLS